MPAKLLCLTTISITAVALARGMHGFAEPEESSALLLVLTTLLALLMHGGLLVVLIAPIVLAHRVLWWSTTILLLPVSLAAVAGVVEGFNKWRATPWLLIFSALFVGLYGFAWTRLFACRCRTHPAL
jgi:hypothetical protein